MSHTDVLLGLETELMTETTGTIYISHIERSDAVGDVTIVLLVCHNPMTLGMSHTDVLLGLEAKLMTKTTAMTQFSPMERSDPGCGNLIYSFEV